jgi:murein DD-endopeptidase MepM/ murein hydrolase activator NlpD
MADRPGSRRHVDAARALIVLVVGVVLAAPVVVPSGAADELDARKQKVERRIEEGQKHLHHSSSRLAASVRRLDRAVAELRRARGALARARDDVAAAEAHDRRMQRALERATEAEARAREALEAGRAAVAGREEELRGVAVQMQSGGGSGLMALSAVIRSKEPAHVTGRLSTRQTLLERNAAAVSRLDASAVVLSVQEAALREATEEAGRRRTAAAESLQRTTVMVGRARAAQHRVRELVDRRREARREAAAAKAEDVRRLRQLRKERDRISQQLRRRAAKARVHGSTRGGSSRTAGMLIRPVKSYVTSPFGMRLHPVYKRWALHDGTDFGAPCGSPIRAARGGTVIGSYHNSAYGKRVIVDHGWVRGAGLGTSYNHLRRFSTHVGKRVRRGEVIGYVGNTGYSTGCHLHFMVFRNGRVVNPAAWL